MRTLALILFLIGIPALVGSIGIAFLDPPYIAPELRKLDPQVAHRLLTFVGLWYALSALASGYGAWQVRPWVGQAYLVFVAAIAAWCAACLYILPIPKDAFTFVAGPIFFGLVALALWKGWRVIRAATVPR